MKTKLKTLATGSLVAVLSATVAATLHAHEDHDHDHPLIAVLTPTEGNDVTGTIIFTEADGKVTIEADVKGLKPNSSHGFHIHEFGDISAADGKSAGGHYNPEKHDHALPDKEVRHAGDLGNLDADADGNAELTLTVDNISLMTGQDPIIGRSVIVHADPDDGGQPTGNAGPRIAMGVIGVENPGD
ncbi:MAG: superoxide dismutase family protein [Chthoniobacterales bacterium]